MGARGKKSSASLSVVQANGITAVDRPGPPDELTDEQAEEWLKVVNRMPAEWFADENHSVLANYCCHVVTARRLSSVINEMETGSDFDIDTYDRLLRMRGREAKAVVAHQRAMRLTHQSKYSKDKGRGSSVRRPW